MSGISVTWGDLISGDDFWGKSNAHAIAYMQVYHSIGVGLAALPIGLAIALRFKKSWIRPATIASIIGSSYMLFDQLRGVWYLYQHGIVPGVYQVVSGTVDVVKVGLILFVVATVMTRLFVPTREPA
jgi:hypothetical protein